MAAPKYEVEIKTLLGEAANADALRAGLKKLDPNCALLTSYTQLNHYFEGGDPSKLTTIIATSYGSQLDQEYVARMAVMANQGTNLSVRTRKMEDKIIFVMKASIGSDSSSNGVVRLEVEVPIKGATLEQLDNKILEAGYHYQAKWSRTREEYKVNDIAVCLDKNAGYGYLAEFEKVIDDADKTEAAKAELEALMGQLGLAELSQARLERMFTHYNEHWPEYYGTDKVFTIE